MGQRQPLYQRILDRVDMSGGPDACWPWTGALNENGYGALSIKKGKQTTVLMAHRAMFELWWHPIPDDLELDHLCHTDDDTCRDGVACAHRRCANPDHLEAVSNAENVRRSRPARGKDTFHGKKTHCPHGHPYEGENLYVNAGRRYCRTCQREAIRSFRERQRQVA